MTKVYNRIGEIVTIFTYNFDSLNRNDVTVSEIHQALDDPARLDIDEGINRSGNPKVMWVGQTESDRLLEVGIEYLDGDIDHVYHANNVQAKYKAMYYRRKK